MGTYDGHSGVIWSISVDVPAKRLLSASGDSSVRLWDVESGKTVAVYPHDAPVRVVCFATGDQKFLSVTDQLKEFVPMIQVFNCETDMQVKSSRPSATLQISLSSGSKVLKAVWGYRNQTIITANFDGTLRVYDTLEHGKQIQVIQAHEKQVSALQLDKWKSTFVTASKDGKCKLWDTKTLQCLNIYDVGRPLNACSLSPLMEHVIMGGGEPAQDVTQTGATSEQFKVRFYNSIFGTLLGSVAGHFGPVNALSFSPDGRSFVSGSEDGHVRLHHFDEAYFKKVEDLRFEQPIDGKKSF
jgi:translation initiation factor 3 subunit I